MGNHDEERFLSKWVPKFLGPSAGHWFIPQVSLGMLLESPSLPYPVDHFGRVDYLFCHPLHPRILAIDICSRHEAYPNLEDVRSIPVGIEYVRVPTDELDKESGPNLAKIHGQLSKLFVHRALRDGQERQAKLVVDCTVASKVQFALAGALWRGWVRPGRNWKVKIKGACSPSAAGVVDLLEMLKAIEVIFDIPVTPNHCSIELSGNGDGKSWPSPISNCEEQESSEISIEDWDCLTIAVETSKGPSHTTSRNDIPDCIIRSAYLPVELAVSQKLSGSLRRKPIVRNFQEESAIHRALRRFLRHLYRKSEFLEGQGKALLNALRHIDTIVLLPTGGGKSIIYQLAGLLMPGITLVIDPLIALMEDQVEGLQSYGIDRAIAIFSEEDASSRESKYRLVESGQFHFVLVSPERLQIKEFRNTIQGLAANIPINLAVIDEAHCVSEWGHDFRPAYLSLANSLRNFTSSENTQAPPVLALTGTASRAVLRDMVNDLEIDANDSDTLIRPESFDRKEIKFKIIRTNPNRSDAELRGELRRLPMEQGIPEQEFYKPRGRNTNSCIVFVPTVEGPTGIDKVVGHVRKAIRVETTCYSGRPPHSGLESNWDQTKRQNARNFKRNEVPILVATNAFGMGIDKPNIRYTIHFGVPSSLEQYYQEAGRAGRDRKEAYSTLILVEHTKTRSDEFLNPDIDIEELRQKHEAVKYNYSARDDITRALYFHLGNFKGTEKDIGDVKNLIAKIIDKPAGIPSELKFDTSDDKIRKETAIYRLYKLGFVKDYTVDFRRKVFEIVRVECEFLRFRDRLLSYVRTVAPGKFASTRRRIDEIDSTDQGQALLDLATVHINFTYDEIERARRRAIQEAILLARQSESDTEIRMRLLEYLQERVGYERIDELIQKEKPDLHLWVDLVEKN